MQVTGAVSWRREGLRYKKNEVYLDIVESINVLMTAKGACRHAHACAPPASRACLTFTDHAGSTATSNLAGVILRSDVSGKIQMRCFLSVRVPSVAHGGSVCAALAAAAPTCVDLRLVRPQGMPELKLGLNDRLSGGDGGGGESGPASSGMVGSSPAGRDGGCAAAAAAVPGCVSPCVTFAR
jgi:hypothetical protein